LVRRRREVRSPMPGSGGIPNAMAIQPDGKIVVAGVAQNTYDFLLVRYHPDGSLDTAFDGDGIVVADMGGTDECFGVAIQTDGKIVVVGRATISGTSNVVIGRYTSSGTLDPTFNDDGLNYPITGAATAVTIQTDGKIVVTGQSQS